MEAHSDATPVRFRDVRYQMVLPQADEDLIQKTIRSTGAPYELDLLSHLADVTSPGDLVVDAGANVGNHSLFLACVAGCRVAAFEPDPNLAGAIKASAELNSVSEQVEVHSVALGAHTGTARLVCDSTENLGGQHLDFASPHTGRSVSVLPLDGFDFGQPVSLLKVDVEGSEMLVLAGAHTTLSKDKPRVLVECLDFQKFLEVESFLHEHGYTYSGVFNATPTHEFVYIDDPHKSSRSAALGAVSAMYDARSRLVEANRKYRTVGKQYVQLREQQQTENADWASKISDLEKQWSARLDEATSALANARSKYRDVTAQYDTLRNAHQDLLRTNHLLVDQNHELVSAQHEWTRQEALWQPTVSSLRHKLSELSPRQEAPTGPHTAHKQQRTFSDALAETTELAVAAGDLAEEHKDEARDMGRKLEHSRADLRRLRELVQQSADRDIDHDALVAELRETIAEREQDVKKVRTIQAGEVARHQKTRQNLEAAQKETGRLKKALADARDGERQERLRSQALRRARDRFATDNDALTADLSQAEDALTQAHEANARLQHDLQDARTQLEDTYRQLQAERAENARLGAELTDQAATSRNELVRVRDSKTFRAGQALRAARTWSGFWKLVPRLIRITRGI